MAAKVLDLDETIQAVECCYLVGRCRNCPLFKETGYGYMGKCLGVKKMVKSLLYWLAMAEVNEYSKNEKLKNLEKKELEDGEEQEDR